jgi:hypothetical protein
MSNAYAGGEGVKKDKQKAAAYRKRFEELLAK